MQDKRCDLIGLEGDVPPMLSHMAECDPLVGTIKEIDRLDVGKAVCDGHATSGRNACGFVKTEDHLTILSGSDPAGDQAAEL